MSGGGTWEAGATNRRDFETNIQAEPIRDADGITIGARLPNGLTYLAGGLQRPTDTLLGRVRARLGDVSLGSVGALGLVAVGLVLAVRKARAR